MRALLLLLCFTCASVQAGSGLTVQSLSYKGKVQTAGELMDATDDQYRMPFVQGDDKAIAASINEQLFQGQFSAPAPASADKHFTLADSAVTEGMASQNFSVSRNDDRILTIIFDNEGCGAYCEGYQTFYSFDVKTGKKITPEDLFTVDGMHSLEQRITHAQRDAYRKMLASLRNELAEARKKQEAGSADVINDLNARIQMNLECSAEGNHTDRTPRVVETTQGFAYDKFELADKTFRLTRERCSNHAMRVLDDVAEFTLALSYPELAAYLTDNGKRLLLEKSASQPVTVANVTANSDAEGGESIGGEAISGEAMQFFVAPQDSTSGLGWIVGGEPLKSGDGWWILACEQDCVLHAASLQVSSAMQDDGEGTQIPAQQLQWLPVPEGNIIAIFRPVAVDALRVKAGVVKTWLHAGMENYPSGRPDTLEISVALPDAHVALLVPRVTAADSEQVDRLELRAYGKRQTLPGYTLPAEESAGDVIDALPWAGDLDGDGKLDLIINHDSDNVDAALYLSSLAGAGELVGLAGSMRYVQPGSGD